ncbi:MAG: lasso peptide biosynthesis B2 protein [Acidobacteriota bacterium]
MLRQLVRRTASVVRMGGARRWLMVEATLWLALAGLALVVLPFRRIASHLGQTLTPAEAVARMAEVPSAGDAPAIVRDVAWAVRVAAAHLPFHALCLQQALAAKCMLRRRRITGALHLGVATRQGPEGTMRAHAWLDAAGVEVTGGPATSEYTEVACFV